MGILEGALFLDQAQDLLQLDGAERLRDVVERSALHRLHGGGDGREAGNHHRENAGPPSSDLGEELEPALPGHFEVGEQHIDALRLEDLKGAPDGRGGEGGVPLIGQEGGQFFPEQGIVVGHEDAHHWGMPLSI